MTRKKVLIDFDSDDEKIKDNIELFNYFKKCAKKMGDDILCEVMDIENEISGN